MFFCFKSLQSVVDISCLFVLSLCDGGDMKGVRSFRICLSVMFFSRLYALIVGELSAIFVYCMRILSRLYALIICKQKAM